MDNDQSLLDEVNHELMEQDVDALISQARDGDYKL